MKKIINWIKNYAYYYKFYVIVAIIIVLIAVFGIWQIFARGQYDYNVYMALSESASGGLNRSCSAVCSQYGKDIDKNGSVNVQIIDLSYDADSPQGQDAMQKTTLLAGEIQSGGNYLFIVDKDRFDSLQENNFFEKFSGANAENGYAYGIHDTDVEEYIKAALRTAGIDPDTLPDLYLTLRKAPEKSNEKQYTIYCQDKEMLENIIKAK